MVLGLNYSFLQLPSVTLAVQYPETFASVLTNFRWKQTAPGNYYCFKGLVVSCFGWKCSLLNNHVQHYFPLLEGMEETVYEQTFTIKTKPKNLGPLNFLFWGTPKRVTFSDTRHFPWFGCFCFFFFFFPVKFAFVVVFCPTLFYVAGC